MITLHWIFRNGHSWCNEYPTSEEAKKAAEYLGLLIDRNVEKTWIEQNGSIHWLKSEGINV